MKFLKIAISCLLIAHAMADATNKTNGTDKKNGTADSKNGTADDKGK